MQHWFDGLAMLYRFAFTQGTVRYSNRWLHSRTWRSAQRGIVAPGQFATNRSGAYLLRVLAILFGETTDNANVNVVAYGADALVALTETPHAQVLDARTLESCGPFLWADKLQNKVATAHPHYDAGRRLIYNCETKLGRRSFYRFTRMQFGGSERSIVAEIESDQPAYLHSFGMSERFLILAEFPLVVRPWRLIFSGRPYIENYRWLPERGLRFTVVDKDSGAIVRRTASEACFSFHHVNAYEEDDAVVVDLVAYPDAGIVNNLYLEKLRACGARANGELRRFRIPLGRGVATRETLSAVTLELPRFDYRRRAGRAYRYVWGAGQDGDFMDCLVKHDLESRKVLCWSEAGTFPSEPVFVAAPGNDGEDNGVILSVVLAGAQQRSFLLVLDAATLREQARVWLPHVVPFGFHGNYYGESR